MRVFFWDGGLRKLATGPGNGNFECTMRVTTPHNWTTQGLQGRYERATRRSYRDW